MLQNKKNIIIIILVVIIANLLISDFSAIFYRFWPDAEGKAKNRAKFDEVIKYIDKLYVDDTDWRHTFEGAIKGALDSLDPHSVYFTVEEAQVNEENFHGKYQGIGIQFDIIEGYITVITVIPGSPSEKVGLAPGDKITKINGISAINISNADVPKKLKGPKGSEVKVTITRPGFEKPFDVTIIRDEIPIATLRTWFMLDDSTGYIWIDRFAQTTAGELEHALILLEKEGMHRLLLDLRDNGGGLLSQAVEVAAKFIEGHKKIVYTKGRVSGYANDHYSDDYSKSMTRDYPLIVLINGGSASASEIVAGAIQDYDRGLIIGENSFGKGLVQNEFVLNDNSRLRLTVSKYYTPSGRLIQKSYKGKSLDAYYNDQKPDSLSTENAKEDSAAVADVYYTMGGRKVFGGGGIKPDKKIEYIGGLNHPETIHPLMRNRVFFETAGTLVLRNPEWKKSYSHFMKIFRVRPFILQELYKQAKRKGLDFSDINYNADSKYINLRIKAEIARNIWGMDKYYQVLLQNDNQVIGAVKEFSKARGLANESADQK